MIHIKSVLERVTPFSAAVALLITSTVPTLMLVGQASAGPLSDRSLKVTSTNASDDLAAPDGSTYTVGAGAGQLGPGDPRNGTQVGHTYTFTPSTSGTIQSLDISYCATPFGYVDLVNDCHVPNDFTSANALSASVAGNTTVTFSRHASSTAGLLKLTGNVAVTAGTPVTVTFTASASNYFVNPSTDYLSDPDGNTWGTYFAHIKTYSDNAWSTMVDEGTVANSIANSIGIYTRVQETLKFSVGTTATATGATCAPLSGNQLTMGDANDALAADTAYDAHSYFRLSTNSSNGVDVMYSGQTLKSGSTLEIAPTGATAATSVKGTEQFGLAIDDTGTQTADEYSFTHLSPAAQYGGGSGTINDNNPANNDAAFAFDTTSNTDPEPIASAGGIVGCDTGSVRYLANISNDTEAGIYQTKINYIASPSY